MNRLDQTEVCANCDTVSHGRASRTSAGPTDPEGALMSKQDDKRFTTCCGVQCDPDDPLDWTDDGNPWPAEAMQVTFPNGR